MVKVILFDNNGVLTTNDDEGTYEKVSRFLGISIEVLKNLISPYVKDLDSGKITQKEFYSLMLKKGGLDFSVDDLMEVHLNSYTPKIEMQEFAKELKKNHKIALLTNFGDAFWDMFEKWDLDKIFSREEVFLSAEIGMAKPDKEIYEYVLDKLKLSPEESIFIDDKEENIVSANEVGINGILFKDKESLINSLKNLGVDHED